MEVKRVRTLLRVSSKQQLHDDDIPLQRAETKDYIKKHEDWVFDNEYIEKAVSAYKNGVEDREVLMQIKEDAENKEFDILLTYMTDRIGRREEYSFYISELYRAGIEVWTVKDGKIKNDEHTDSLITYIRFWQNEEESRKLGKRVRDALIKEVEEGKFVGGKAPYGYQLVETSEKDSHKRNRHKMVIVEKQAEVVRKIYDLYIHQGYGYEKIAKELNKEGVPAISADKWKNGTICSILKNPIYMGYYSIHRREKGKNFKRLDRSEWILSKEQVKDIVIVSQYDWEKAQEIRESKKARLEEKKKETLALYEEQYSAPFNPRGKLSLLGIACCGYCGKRLKSAGYNNHWVTKDGTKKVSCIGRYGCQERCAERSYYSQDFLESVVFEVVENYLERLKEVNISEELNEMKKQKISSVEKEQKRIAKEIDKKTKDIKTLEDALPNAFRGESGITVERLSRMIDEKEKELAELAQDKVRLQEQIEQTNVTYDDFAKFIDIAPNWKQVFKEADVPTKRMLLASLIERIDVKDEDINIKFRIRLEDFKGHSGEGEKIRETVGSDTIPCKRDSA
ncbi:MAG: recombinase family protein [Lachnospiraceae bacterium]|nr:recombinase family protein [Lachnospiraceae bacterium]